MSLSEEPDRLLLDHLRRYRCASVGDLGGLLGVTATAIRQRLTRLMAEGLIERQLHQTEGPDGETRNGRGRPSYDYRLTERGRQAVGDNYHDLAEVLWEEIRGIEDLSIRRGLIKRLADRLASRYIGQVGGEDLAERMHNLMELMGEREVPVAVDESGNLPVLTLLACPYPGLAEQDRSICAVEKAMISEVLGQGVKLSECRLDGGGCCSFEPSGASLSAETVEAGSN